MNRMICFDMDGTIADLYGVADWLPRLRAEDADPYREAQPLYDMEKLNAVLRELICAGWEIRVISWLRKGASENYNAAVRAAKQEWLARYNFPAAHVHLVKYGTTKANTIRRNAEYAVLVDDNARVRNGWHLGDTINPLDGDLIERLENLLR